MACVIERFGVDTSGEFIVFDDRPSSYETAEKIARKRLDRRKNYCIIDGEVCESCEFTQPCSGCNGEWDATRGSGCHECGYTGKVRRSQWVPLWAGEID